jgi:hypothetical protein
LTATATSGWARISNLGIPAGEVDTIMLSLFGKQEGAASEVQAAKPAAVVQSIQQPTALPMQARTLLNLRAQPLVAVAVKPTTTPLVSQPVAKKASSAAGPMMAGAAAGLLFGGPIGAAAGAGAGFLLSKLGKK